jgi:ABC-type lipoprotein release transport system permease subunit
LEKGLGSSRALSLVAVFLACIGIYGLMSHAVLHRTNEIGVRMALGAQQGQVLSLIMRQGLVLAAAGVAAGIALAVVLPRFLATLLFGVQPLDAVTFVCVALLLMLISLAACYLPRTTRDARRSDRRPALRIDGRCTQRVAGSVALSRSPAGSKCPGSLDYS